MNMIGFFLKKRDLPQDRVIPAGSQYSGDFQILLPVRVEGTLEGTLHAALSVEIAPGGRLQGSLKCRKLLVSGEFSGEAECDEIHVLQGGRLTGRILCHTLVLQRGGFFEGQRIVRFPEATRKEKNPALTAGWRTPAFLTPLFHGGRSA